MQATTYRYHFLGGFRLFLAGLVVVQHYTANVAPLGRFRDTVLSYEVGSLAVLVFFALSGFVITESASKVYAGKPLEFMLNRLLRIVPHIVVGVVIAVFMYAAFEHWGTLRLYDREHPLLLPSDHAFSLRNIAANMLSWVPGMKSLTSFEYISIVWAVRIEMLFYGVVFVLLWVPASYRGYLPRLIPFTVVALTLAVGLVHYRIGYALFFLYGALLYRREIAWMLLCIPGMVLYLVEVPGGSRAVGGELVLLTLLFAILSALALTSTRRNPIDQRAGDLSYPVYIHHINAEVFVLSALSGYGFGLVGLATAVALLLAFGLTLIVDPTINRMRDHIRGSRLAITSLATGRNARRGAT